MQRLGFDAYSEMNPLAAAVMLTGPIGVTIFKLLLGGTAVVILLRHRGHRLVAPAVAVVLVFHAVTLHRWAQHWQTPEVQAIVRGEGSSWRRPPRAAMPPAITPAAPGRQAVAQAGWPARLREPVPIMPPSPPRPPTLLALLSRTPLERPHPPVIPNGGAVRTRRPATPLPQPVPPEM
jgi:hypothetical protein